MRSAYKSVLLSASLMAILLPGAGAEDLSSKHIFDGAATTRTIAGASEDIHLSVQSWGIRAIGAETVCRRTYPYRVSTWPIY